MNNRERFFKTLKGEKPDKTPYFPDITSWYENTRKVFGEVEIFGPGVYIPDDIDFHSRESKLNSTMAKMTFLDYYREYDWGLPVHMYSWNKKKYSGGIEEKVKLTASTKEITISTPIGELKRNYVLDSDGSWATSKYWIEDIKQLDILKYIVSNTHYIEDFSFVEKFLRETEGFGV